MTCRRLPHLMACLALLPLAVAAVGAPSPGIAGEKPVPVHVINLPVPVLVAPGATELRSHTGETVEVMARVVSYRAAWSDTAPNILTLQTPGEQTVEAVFWLNERPFDPAGLTESGAAITVQGRVQEYRGRMQVRVTHLDSIRALSPGEAARLPQVAPTNNPFARLPREVGDAVPLADETLAAELDAGVPVVVVVNPSDDQPCQADQQALLDIAGGQIPDGAHLYAVDHGNLIWHPPLAGLQLPGGPALVVLHPDGRNVVFLPAGHALLPATQEAYGPRATVR